MKRLFLFALPLLMVACQEDFIGQYPVDSIPPSKVSNAVVENYPGKVVITYDLPSDTDLLYVKAVYKDSHGEKNEVRASNFKNQLEIKGFSKSERQSIELVSVDRSQNESEPLRVEIEPLDSPIYSILESVHVSPSWGGMKITWDNPDSEQIFIYVSAPGEDGEEQLVQTIISQEAAGNTAIRGLEAVEKEFHIVVRDIYENYTDTLTVTITPLYEIFIQPTNFVLTALATNMNWHKTRNNVGALFDGVKTSDKPIYEETKVKKDGIYYAYFTVDLADTYKLSRVKFWGRVKYCYALHCPKHFQMWGTASPEAAADPDNWDGWEMLLEGWSYKPSGYETSDVTAEDQEYANNGEEVEIPESANALRYFRFVSLETWTQSNSLNLNEMEFYGAEYNL